jgi:predicted TIM-barrel fold metal-dependent hydrolase
MTSLLELARQGAPLNGLDISDMHGHVGRYNFGIPDLSLAGMVAAMDRLGIDRIVCSHMRCMSADIAWGNDQVLDAMRRHPGRILGYFSVWPDHADAVRREAERCLAQPFTGLKLHNANGIPYDDPAYAPAYELCHDRHMPVLLHTWGDAREFESVRVLALRYPALSILLAHAGSANTDRYIAIARECPNVYLDTALSVSTRGLIERLVKGAGAHKVVWGSDSYFFSPAQQIGKVLGAAIPDADKLQILSLNARRLIDGIVSR